MSQTWADVTRDFYVAPTGTIPGITEPHVGWTKVGCYDAISGVWLDCPFTQEITGIKEPDTALSNNGGHAHPNHPLIEPQNAVMEYDANTCQGQQLKVCGNTRNTIENLITHGIPQASGKIEKKLVITTPAPDWWPRSWTCIFGCGPTSYTFIDTFNVEVPNLEELPEPGSSSFYEKLRGGTNTHPQGHHGIPYALQMISLIAENYWLLSGNELSVNDMSLPEGGLFDLRNDWSTDKHQEHHVGTSVDINRKGIHCLDNKNLRTAVEMLAPPVIRKGQKKSALLCEFPEKPLEEGGGLYHIYLDQISIVRIGQ